MINLFFVIMLLFIGSIALYYLVIHIIKRWTGCDNAEAEQKIHNFVNGKTLYSLASDERFIYEVWENIRKIIGDKRFEQLHQLSQTALGFPLLAFGQSGSLPYVTVTLNCVDDSEKRKIERVLCNLVKQFTQINSNSNNVRVLTDWKTNSLNMPFLEIRYATNKEENRTMDEVFKNMQQNILTQNSAITDDEDENDLDE